MNIGDSLFKAISFSGIGEYVVTGVINREKAVLYEIESKFCNHIPACRLCVTIGDYGKSIVFAHMLNDDDTGSQRCWHNDGNFYKTRNEAKIAYYKKSIENCRKYADEARKTMNKWDEEANKVQQHLDNII